MIFRRRSNPFISNHAAKGWSSIGGPPISKILEASMTAMDSIYEAATEVLKKANALANETLAASVNEVLGRIEKTGLSRSNLTADAQLSQKRQHLAAQFKRLIPK
jgi:hypothetical protein